jgi:hypothetical protein
VNTQSQIIDNEECFELVDTGQWELEQNTTADRKWQALCTSTPNIYGASFPNLSTDVLYLKVGLHQRNNVQFVSQY